MKITLNLLTLFLIFVISVDLSLAQEPTPVEFEEIEDDTPEDSTHASDNSGFEIGIGGSYLFDKEINEDFKWGFNAGLRLRLDIPNSKISISPLGYIRTYSQPVKGNSRVNNKLTIYKIGLQLSIQLYKSSNDIFSVWNYFELNQSWLTNDFKWEVTNSGSFPNQNSSNSHIETENIFKGQSVTNMIGYRIRYGIIFIEAGYDLYSSHVTWSNALIQFYKSENIDYDPDPKFSANSININIGISVPFNKMNNRSGFFTPM